MVGRIPDIPPRPINDRDIPSVRIPPQRLRKAASIYQPGDSEYYVEYMELCPAVSSAITAFGRIVPCRFLYLKDLLGFITASAAPGQIHPLLLREAPLSDAVQIINGDKTHCIYGK